MRRKKMSLAAKILIAMLLGFIVGFAIKFLPNPTLINHYLVDGVFFVVGKVFIDLLEMIVVPIVFVSIICGTSSIRGDQLGRVGLKVVLLFLLMTAIATGLGIFFANLFHIGAGLSLKPVADFHVAHAVSLKDTMLNLIPSNPVEAMAQGNLLQVIVFAILIGIAISASGESGKKIAGIFKAFNDVLMKLIMMVMKFAPYGVFCLIAGAMAKIGVALIGNLFSYMLVVLLVLAIQLFGVYSLLLSLMAHLNPMPFFKKMYPAMIFAFGTSSSNASIPVVLQSTEEQLGVDSSIASFTIPLGATIHMDGTAIMQGVAAVFIAHIYNVPLSMTAYLTIIATTTLASIGTAGVPSVGVITLAMVLQSVGIPIAGIGLIIGIDRIIDMCRTIINVMGDAVTACIVAKSEKELDRKVYKK